MKIFVFEHVSGGGMVHQDLACDLTAQGRAMLIAVVSDLVGAGLTVCTTRDARVEPVLAGARVVAIDSDSTVGEVFYNEANAADVALVIAPETDGTLQHWCSVLRDARVRSLGSVPEAVGLCADKLALSRRLRASGVPTPVTWPAEDTLNPVTGENPTATVVEKPVDGAGCERTTIHRVHNGGTAPTSWASRGMVRQIFVPGTPVSVSFVLHAGAVHALPAGRQVIERRGNHLWYRGGCLPLERAAATRATALARRAVDAVPGLQGFVGVDLVLADEPDGDRVLEINPRLTVSYVGLRAMCRTNLAAAMIDCEVPLKWSREPVRFDANGRLLV